MILVWEKHSHGHISIYNYLCILIQKAMDKLKHCLYMNTDGKHEQNLFYLLEALQILYTGWTI